MNCKQTNSQSAKGTDRRPIQVGGFTLVELMVVVAIVAVLASVAIVAYTRHLKKGRLVGARAFIAHIQARQATYMQQHGVYSNTSGQTGTAVKFAPALEAGAEPVAKAWNATTLASEFSAWSALGARPDAGNTYVAVFVGASLASNGHALNAHATAMQIPAQPTGTDDAGTPMTAHPWYFVVAHGDFDGSETSYTSGGCSGSGPTSVTNCSVLWATSARSEIVVRNEGH
ncbi:MAG: prepilin-type N-terminal cleavage/methylation domain-containing protein [Deltaproteobacteria bacterium]|nr:prepilin-type N-terminal cleavage/methylation domain-containing protein [Deltaproteobacteria bacterium]